MKPKYLLTALALSVWGDAALAEQTLAPIQVTPGREDVQGKTALGTLTEATPMSGTVVNQEELQHLQIVNGLLELSKRVPGFSMIRNLRISDGGKNYTENRVDGMRVSLTSTQSITDELSISNIERIEVITGPGSALYGSGALGAPSIFSPASRPDPWRPNFLRRSGVGASCVARAW